jgi:hypothetical protein
LVTAVAARKPCAIMCASYFNEIGVIVSTFRRRVGKFYRAKFAGTRE